jgi:uracil-DNA glycosylase
MRAILVGEAWGRREKQFSHALVGPSGRELTLQMAIAKFAPYMDLLCRKCSRTTRFIDAFCEHCREYVWPNEFDLIAHWRRLREDYGIAISNVFNEQPPDLCGDCGSLDVQMKGRNSVCKACGSTNVHTNELGYFFGTEPQTPMSAWKASKDFGGSHLKREYFHHVERLWREIDLLQPNLIVCLGNCPCWAILDQTRITSLRGTVSKSDRLGLKCLATFHPAAVLRQTQMRPTCIADFQKASREIEFPEIRRQDRWITIIDPTIEGIREGYEWFQRPARAYANDIETHSRQITIIGFARSIDDALVIPFRNEPPKRLHNPNYETELAAWEPNYWPTPELEREAWKLAQHGLQTPQPKIFQNGLYDMSYELRLGLQPRNAIHDTMLWHHSLYPELPKSLGFLGSIYAAEINWKSMRNTDTLKRDE